MATIFLAYADKDRVRALAVRGYLTKQGFDIWEHSGIAVGTDWRLSILDRLRDAGAIVVLISSAAASSEWVTREIGYAKTSGTPIVPLLLEGEPLPELSDLQHSKVNPDGSVQDQVVEYLRSVIEEPEQAGTDAARHLIEALGNRTISLVVDEVQQRVVLLLGNFSDPNLDRLSQLQAALERRGFHPVIFNFDRPKSADYGETIRLLAGLAGFIVADMSDPRSVAMEMQLIAPELSVPIVPVIAADQEPLALFGDFFGKYDWVLPTYRYKDIASLVEELDKALIAPAQQKLREISERKAASSRRVPL